MSNSRASQVALIACAVCALMGSTSQADDQPVIEEVVVTAQKREQSIQDVPIAISAFDRQFLDEAGIDDVFELQFFVPGLTVYNSQSAAQTNFNIRGVGTAGNSVSLESSVGLYVDGVYRARQSSAINDLVDLERVEVLKGPQGTLFGKNTASGAIQFLTVAPQLDDFSGYLEVNGGSESYANLNGAINIPVIDGKAAARFSAGWTQRDGYVDNTTTGTEQNERDRFSVRGQLMIYPTDALSIRVIADHSEIDESCCSAANIFDGPGDTTAAFIAAGGIPFLMGPPGTSYRASIEDLGGDVVLADRFNDDEVALNVDPSSLIEESGISVEISWDLSDTATLTSITAFRDYEATNITDGDFTSLGTLRARENTDQETFTQEFRLTGSWGQRLSYVAGAYYFDQDLDNHLALRIGEDGNRFITGGATLGMLDALGAFEPVIPAGAICAGFVSPALVPLCPLPAFPPDEGADDVSSQSQQSWAVFAQGDIHLTDDLILTLGVRYTDEEKDMNVTFIETIPTPVYAGFTPFSPLIPDLEDVRYEQDQTTGTAKLTYHWNDSLMTYASYGRGYKSGGTNIARIDPATGAPLLFDPETSDAYEIGLKTDLLDQRLRVNAALYRMNFDDFQENTFVGTGFVLQNAGKIETQGGELEIFALPTHWLSLQAGAAYVDAEYESFLAGACTRTPLLASPDAAAPAFPVVCDNSGNVVPGTPEWTLFGSARVDYALASGNVYAQLDVNWRDETANGNDNDANKRQDSFTLVNLRLGYRFAQDRYDISLWGKNVFDEDYHGGSFNSVIREGSISAFHTEPATWGLTFRATY